MLDAVHPPEPSAPAPPQVPPARTPGAQGLAIIVAVVIVAALYYGREVLMPVTLAVLLSFVLSPLVELLRRVWLGRILSVALAVILALAIILGLGTAIGTQVAQLAKNVPQYQTTIERKIATLRDVTVKKLLDTIQSVSHEFAPAQKPAETAPAAAGGGMQTQEQKPVPVVVTEPGLSALQIGEKVLTPILNPLATTGIILVVTIFTLLQKEDLRDRAIRLFGSSDLERTTVALDDAARRLSRYFLTQLGMNTGFGVIVAIGLYFIGVPNPVLWGVLGALLRFIPYIGSWIAALLPIALAAAVAPGWSMAIWTAALYIVTEVTLGQAVEPLVYGHTTGLSPIAVIIAAIFWTWVWGPIGLIISTPLTLCLVLLGRYVEHLEFLDVLLGDRPALTPVESFYQRLLAGDPDAVEEQAERHLNDLPLSSYYDEVALKGLQLAAIDVARGALNASKVDTLKEAIKELVAELDAYEDDEPTEAEERQTVAGPTADQKGLPKASPPADADRGDLPPEWQGEAPVLCIAGRGPLDEAASAMLAQLLGKHGLGARTVPHDAVSRSHIAGLDTGGVAMVCVSYLDISGNPAHLRYLLRRLRARLPWAPLLVGLWPADDPVLRDPELGRTVGADYYVGTLRAAVAACLAAAHNAAPRPRQPALAEDPGAAPA